MCTSRFHVLKKKRKKRNYNKLLMVLGQKSVGRWIFFIYFHSWSVPSHLLPVLLLSKDNQLLAPADYLQLQIYGPDKRIWKWHQCLISSIKNARWRAKAKSDYLIQPSSFVERDPIIKKKKKNFFRALYNFCQKMKWHNSHWQLRLLVCFSVKQQ